MTRTITVKGIGNVSTKPDCVVISMTLESKHQKYDKAMNNMAAYIKDIKDTLTAIGFEKDSLKTTEFEADTDYDRVRDKNGNWNDIFRGYIVENNLKLKFDFDMEKLSQTLSAISQSKTNPKFSIDFTVNDASKINEELLQNATKNAKRKAEILCKASGVKLGDLVIINYDWSEINIKSSTNFRCCEESSMDWMALPMDIEPENINVTDTATFVWEIV